MNSLLKQTNAHAMPSMMKDIEDLETFIFNLSEDLSQMLANSSNTITAKELELFNVIKNEEIQNKLAS